MPPLKTSYSFFTKNIWVPHLVYMIFGASIFIYIAERVHGPSNIEFFISGIIFIYIAIIYFLNHRIRGYFGTLLIDKDHIIYEYSGYQTVINKSEIDSIRGFPDREFEPEVYIKSGRIPGIYIKDFKGDEIYVFNKIKNFNKVLDLLKELDRLANNILVVVRLSPLLGSRWRLAEGNQCWYIQC